MEIGFYAEHLGCKVLDLKVIEFLDEVRMCLFRDGERHDVQDDKGNDDCSKNREDHAGDQAPANRKGRCHAGELMLHGMGKKLASCYLPFIIGEFGDFSRGEVMHR